MKTAGLNVPFRITVEYGPCFYREVLLVHRILSISAVLHLAPSE